MLYKKSAFFTLRNNEIQGGGEHSMAEDQLRWWNIPEKRLIGYPQSLFYTDTEKGGAAQTALFIRM